MLRKLRIKFVGITMAIVTAMLLVIFGLVYHFTAENLERESVSFLKSVAQSAQQHEFAGKQEGRLPYFTLQISNWGNVIASGSGYFDLNDEEFLNELLRVIARQEQTMGIIEDHHLRYYRITDLGGQIIAFVDISSQERTLELLLQISVLIGILSIGGFLVVSIFLARWAVRPVEKAWQQQRQFVSDASHELKTPLTVIMSNAELLQSQDCDPESRERFAGSILTMSYQMRKLVEGLLELARVDNGQVKKAFEPLDLSLLVEEALLPFEPVLFEQGLELGGSIQPGIGVMGNGQYLKQVVDILLDNAAKYSQPGLVTVSLQRVGRGQCVLAVETPGQPIPKEELTKIFERFYRRDGARSRTGSFGLGLAIAQSTVREHQGRIWAESGLYGNRFCVQLPCN